MINMRAVRGLGDVDADLQASMTASLMRAKRYVDPPTSDRVISQVINRSTLTRTYREGVAGPECQALVAAIPDIDDATRDALYQTCLADPVGFRAQAGEAFPQPFYRRRGFKIGVGVGVVAAVLGGVFFALR